MNDALASILSQRFGDGEIQTEISGVFAGPIEIPIPDEMKNPAKLMRFVGNVVRHAVGACRRRPVP